MTAEEQIRLRPIERSDLEYLRDLANDEVVRANVVGWDWPLSLAGQEAWFNSSESAHTRRFIVELTSGEPIGMTGLWDIDWHSRVAMTALKIGGLAPLRGRGFGVKAIHALMRFAFEDVGLNRLYSSIIAGNEASIGAYVRKSGWQQEGIQRQQVWRNGTFHDVCLVGILRSEYLSHQLNSEPK